MHGYRPLYEATMRQREFTAFRGSAAAAAANEACFSFGNGCQAIQIARACFGRFFQMRLEII